MLSVNDKTHDKNKERLRGEFNERERECRARSLDDKRRIHVKCLMKHEKKVICRIQRKGNIHMRDEYR